MVRFPYPSVEDYVKERTQTLPRAPTALTRVIKKVLIANNGIGAVKAQRSIRRWAFEMFGNDKAIQFVAMATPDDMRANAEYIRMADEVVDVPGGSNNNNYANVSLIVDIAERWQVDAVWAGWGHASENPNLPNSLERIGVAFIGPPGRPMQALGDKIGSTIIAQSAGVSTIAWNGDGITCNYKENGLSDEIYQKANITTVDQAMEAASRVGYPVMIKASEGGGGKGIRKVTDPKDLPASFRQVQGEIPGSPIFIMKLAPKSRHLEVQLLADAYGDAIALNGRDCSVQRRHQKIIEEGPPIAAQNDIWRQMEKAAVALAKEVGYVNAGTVEYLYSVDDGNFAFLELNPRLQVEHPVTEMITRINLPACQLQVAMGIPLYRIPDIRKFYGFDPFGDTIINFEDDALTEKRLKNGHCIAVRITAENPDLGFKPTSGTIQELNFRSTPDVWGYFSVDSSGLVHEFADSQFGHLFAAGIDREAARKSMVLALRELSIRGDIRTTVEYISILLQSKDFIENCIDTAWLDKRIADHATVHKEGRPNELLVVMAGCVVTSFKRVEEKSQEFVGLVGRGQTPSPSLLESVVKQNIELIYEDIKYVLQCSQSSPNSFTVTLNGSSNEATIRSLADDGFLIVINKKSHVVYVKEEPSGLRMVLDGQTCIFTKEYDPTKLATDAAGKIARLLVPEGTHLKKGEPFVEIESMKMYMNLYVGESGTIHWKMSEGATLSPGDLMATLELDDPGCVKMAPIYGGKITPPETLDGKETFSSGYRPHHLLQSALTTLQHVMEGYVVNESKIDEALSDLSIAIQDPLLPYFEFMDPLSVLSGRIDLSLHAKLTELMQTYRAQVEDENKKSDKNSFENDNISFPVSEILELIQNCMTSMESERDQTAFLTTTETLRAVVEMYMNGSAGRTISALLEVVRKYVAVERLFANNTFEDAMTTLRKQYTDYIEVKDFCRSHLALHRKNLLMLKLMKKIHRATENARQVKMPRLGTGTNSMISQDKSRLRTSLTLSSTEVHEVEKELRHRSSLVLLDENDLQIFVPILTEISNFQESIYAPVMNQAQAILLEQSMPSGAERLARFENMIQEAIAVNNDEEAKKAIITQYLDQHGSVVKDLFPSLGDDKTSAYRMITMEAYIRKVYKMHNILNLHGGQFDINGNENNNDNKITYISWIFKAPTADLMPVGLSSSGSALDLTSMVRNTSQQGVNAGGSGSLMKRSVNTSSSIDLANLPEKDSSNLGYSSPLQGSPKSTNNISSLVRTKYNYKIPQDTERLGVAISVSTFQEIDNNLGTILSTLFIDKIRDGHSKQAVNALHVYVTGEREINDESHKDVITNLLRNHLAALQNALIRRATFVVPHYQERDNSNTMQSTLPSIYTFRAKSNFDEDSLFRHIEPSLAFHLDLNRFANFNIEIVNTTRNISGELGSHNVHLYEGTPKENDSLRSSRNNPSVKRYFARLVATLTSHFTSEVESMLVSSLSAITLALGSDDAACIARGEQPRRSNANHIFINIDTGNVILSPDMPLQLLKTLSERYQDKITRSGVSQIELKIICRLGDENTNIPVALRLIAANPTGLLLEIDTYMEVKESENSPKIVLKTFGTKSKLQSDASYGELEGMDITAPYPISRPFEKQRAAALASSDTLYCYDYLALIERAVQLQWEAYANDRGGPGSVRIPSILLDSVELVVQPKRNIQGNENQNKDDISTEWVAEMGIDNLELVEQSRPRGMNDVGMVAWKVTMFTPEFPDGRQIILISNDITFQAGSFGTREDIVFALASAMARKNRLPRIYLAANSGARIGMADSLKGKFKVAWIKEQEPELGFHYLYLTKDDYNTCMETQSVNAKRIITDQGEERYVIEDIIGSGIGKEKDLGVENLQGSGRIAGETSIAYNDIFTLTLVTGRTVGIGAYLVRLGQRTIQKRSHAPIILTGFNALNKLMGADVYTSNEQLGGPMIMYPNGVSHLLVQDHLDAVKRMCKWLSFIPRVKGGPLPIHSHNLIASSFGDPIDRSIAFTPSKGVAYDPRHLLAGYTDEVKNGEWVSGFFDKDSFMETLGGWAKTVVVGRARLGGIPVGVIITESRTAEAITPADPADSTSQERQIQQAGGVWFPDSAYKTSQAIKDFEGEDLPLMIFANWRGFSGGQRDMFDEVLKFGSMIVDALVSFTHPIMVYIPPFAELRGGAWVVVDPTINADVMEMYAANDARGGVLEANGASAIKFRRGDYIKAAHRLDKQLQQLDEELSSPNIAGEEKNRLLAEIKKRENAVASIYSQIATHFADLHDTPGRMVAVGAIRKVIPWESARSYFYNRLRRKTQEFYVRDLLIRECRNKLTKKEAMGVINSWYIDAVTNGSLSNSTSWEEDDQIIGEWLSNMKAMKQNIKDYYLSTFVPSEIKVLLSSSMENEENSYSPVSALNSLFASLPEEEKQNLLARLMGN